MILFGNNLLLYEFMKQITIYFEDFWPEFNRVENFITNILQDYYEIRIDSKNPDYLFFSVYGFKHLKYNNCIRIFYSMENIWADFNFCDYAISSQLIEIEDRHIRYPYYNNFGFERLENKQSIDKQKLLDRKFCNFVYSNNSNANPIRERFFHELSKYKKVDSGGRFLNNIGKPVVNKLDFIKDYKFTIAFENSSLPGYTTEKIVEPMVVNSMPVYWGNPNIELDFNKNSFIYVNDFSSIEKAIEEVIRLDKDDNAYLKKISEPWFLGSDYYENKEKLTLFLTKIINQDKESSKRLTNYGYISAYREKIESLEWSWWTLRKIMKIRRFFKNLFLAN